jgi:CubicO group peptidase (beta-lactamase class C family)
MKQLLIAFSILCFFFSLENKIYSQNTDNKTSDLNTWIDSQFSEGMKVKNIAGATIVLMQGDSILHINGYGLADINSNTPVNCNSSIFGLASISKTFVGTAIMQLYESGKLELDRDVNNYLKSIQLEYKFKDSITVEHLLTHTAGLDDRNIATSARTEQDVISLAEYLKKRMPPQVQEPGKVHTYSNQGYALLGLIVEDVSGMPFHEYVRKMILKPLEMNYSGFKRQTEFEKNYVTSYLQKGTKLIPYQPDYRLDYPASSMTSTASDMGHYISMFLNKGNYKGNQILDSTTVVKMHQTAFKPIEKSDRGWLLGFSESHWNGIRLVRHAGHLQGFANELVLIPEKNMGLFISLNSSTMPNSNSNAFMYHFIHKLFSRLMPESFAENENVKISPTIGSVDEPLEKFTGKYRYTRYAHTTFDKVAILLGFAPEIEIISRDGRLEIVEWNEKLDPISDLTFHSKYDKYFAFGKDKNGEISYFFADSFSYQKLKWYEPVKFQTLWIGSIVLILVIFIISNTGRKLFVRKRKSHLINKINFSLASFILLFLSLMAFTLRTTDPQEFFYGIPMLIKMALVLPFLIIPLELITIYLLTKAIRLKELGTFDLVYQSLILVTAMFFIPWLAYFNLIGFNY